ncbi:DUF1304 domain-containing protein [Microbacterium sp. nov. GSS16]|uniref:DUF1304 domain-containing protein n=1 Tax=Microbacterium sp. nov. GSS16 TaxID=3019890 RepID=UPI0023063FB6|nr:DUF1304 domain-containing protein [Microbacterium sp. nov. GSS16]WCD92460.1 DUF1304 domain-containing protein [Microbacterium sp. nov. GSS16]
MTGIRLPVRLVRQGPARVGEPADAETTRPLAFNQGFYNLFLALAAFLGVVLVAVGAQTAGVTLALAGTGMMLAAALVLVFSDRTKLCAAATQGTAPLLAVIALTVWML